MTVLNGAHERRKSSDSLLTGYDAAAAKIETAETGELTHQWESDFCRSADSARSTLPRPGRDKDQPEQADQQLLEERKALQSSKESYGSSFSVY
jgi:hypothetical protein